MNKIFKGVIISLLAATGLVSCSDSFDYTPAQAPTNAQVYFPTSNQSSYSLDMADAVQTFNVPIQRANAGQAITVNLISSVAQHASVFTIPSSVSFADGQTETTIPVSYNPAALGYDTPDTLNIKIGDADLTPYGNSDYKFVVVIPSPWRSLGKAIVRDDLIASMFSVDNLMWEVEMQENELEPGFYRLVNPYNTLDYLYNEEGDFDPSPHYFYIHAEDPDAVYFERTYLGVDWGYGDFNVWSIADYFVQGGNDPADVKAAGYYGTLKEGVITFPTQGILINLPDYNPTGFYYANAHGLFAIVLPGYSMKDFSSALEFSGIFTNIADEVFAVGNLTLGEDVEVAKAVVVEADADPEAVADAIAAGDLESVDVAAGQIYVPVSEDMRGKLQIVVAVLDGSDVKSVASANFEYYGGGGNPWQSLGQGYLLDNFIITMYLADAATETPWEPQMYEVEIQESTETPGLYRVVNAFAGVAELISVGYTPTPIEVDATNPNTVFIMPQFSGVTDADGDISIATYGGYLLTRYSMSDLNPGYFGQLEDGVIIFPSFYSSDKSFTFQGLFIQGTSAYYTGYDATAEQQFAIILPSASAPAKANALKKAKAADFARRLHGNSSAKKSEMNKFGAPYKKILCISNAKLFK